MPLKQILRMDPNSKDDDQSSKAGPQPAPTLHRKGPNFAKKKDKFGRKRSQSFSGVNSKFCPPYKYRTRPMLPTKFLLGGNICDPLNLNSLQDEEINRTVNAITPKSSPIPTPPQRRGHIEVIIPPNIHDPLNLIDCADDAEYEQQLTSPLKKGNKRRKKKKRTSSATTEPSDADISASEAQTPDLSNDSAKIPDLEPTSTAAEDACSQEKLTKVTRELKLELSPVKEKKRKSDSHKEGGVKKLRRMDSMDKIVSPVVPQPGAWLKRALQFNRNAGPSNRGLHNRPSGAKTKEIGGKVPHFRDKNKAYQYGNYNRYYGYRNPNHEVDSRLRCFAAHRHIFEGRDILDIGCNIGHITLSIARDFGAKSVVGIDIDKKLIGIARKNVRHYVNCNDSPHDEPECSSGLDKNDKCFPISMPILYGPVDVPGMQNDEVKGRGFPHNVTFVQGNYVLEDDSLLCTEQPQFDVILCLSITKWLHLNWGDQGLKQAFRRMYAQLKPGGRLILEPQSWASYKHKKTLTETIYKNYNSIEFFPEKFTQYLLSSEVGFAKSEIMGQPHHTAKGFQRPIQVFTRSNLSPSQSQRSYSITPSHTVTSGSCRAGGVAGKQVYTCLPSPDVCTEDAAGVRVDLDASCAAVARGTEHLAPVRGATDERGAGRSTAGQCMGGEQGASSYKGTGTENTGDKEVTGKEIADQTGNRSGNVVEAEERAGKFTDRASSIADKRERGCEMAVKQEKGCKITDKQEKGCKITDKQEKGCKIADKQESVSKIADTAEIVSNITDKHEQILENADNQAKITDKPAKSTEEATITDNQAKITEKQAKITDNLAEITHKQAKITDNQARIADNQAKVADNQAKITDNQAKITQKAKITDNQAKITEKATITDNQAEITHKQATITDNQATITEKPAKITDNQAIITHKPTNSPVNQTIPPSSPDNQTKPPNTPVNQATTYTNATKPTPTPTNAPDNQASSPGKPHNQVTSPLINNKCKNITELCDNKIINALHNVGSHLGTTTSATAVTCGGVGTKKRKHPAPGSPDSESTPAKRQFVSPVKRKTNSLAVKRKYDGDITCIKRKNLQSTTDSTLTDTDGTVARGDAVEMDGDRRLDDTRTNHEEISTDCQSTTGKSTTNKSTQYRLMQKTRRIMDNT